MQKLKFRNAFFAHDYNNKTTAVLNTSTNVKFEESLDRNHAVKAIERRFARYFEKELKVINSKNAALNEFATNVMKDKSIMDENIKSFMRKQTKNEPKIQKKYSYHGRVWTAIRTQNNPHFKSEMIKIVDKNHRVSPSLAQRLYYNESQAEFLQQSRRTSVV